VLAVIKFRIAGRMEKGSYKIPGGYIIPGLSAFVIIWLLSNLPLTELVAMLIFISFLTMIYLILKLPRQRN
jgi:hypothetical protein